MYPYEKGGVGMGWNKSQVGVASKENSTLLNGGGGKKKERRLINRGPNAERSARIKRMKFSFGVLSGTMRSKSKREGRRLEWEIFAGVREGEHGANWKKCARGKIVVKKLYFRSSPAKKEQQRGREGSIRDRENWGTLWKCTV